MAKGSPWRYAVLAVVLLAGCLTTRQVIPIDYTGSAAPVIDRYGGYESDVKAIVYVMVEEFEIPRVEGTLFIYPSQQEYEAGFVTELGVASELAPAKTQALAVTNCQYKKVLAKLSGLPWEVRVRTLAHEMTHLAQFALGGWTCRSPHAWLTEGFAHWAAYRVLDRLGIDSFAAGKEAAVKSIVELRQSGGDLPALSLLAASRDWDAAARVADKAAYGRVLLAADYLVEKKGAAAVVDYFRRFERSNDRSANFKAAFGQDSARFEAGFNAHLEKLLM